MEKPLKSTQTLVTYVKLQSVQMSRWNVFLHTHATFTANGIVMDNGIVDTGHFFHTSLTQGLLF